MPAPPSTNASDLEATNASNGIKQISEPATITLLLVALAFCGGYMDAVSYLGLGRVFTANMTGNTVLLGIAIAGLHAARVLGSLVALLGYCAGVAIGTAILVSPRAGPPDAFEAGNLDPRDPGAGEPSRAWRTLACQTLIILLLMILWMAAPRSAISGSMQLGLITLSAIAMGMQTESARCISIGGVSTTFVTGTLSDLSAAAIVRALRASPVPLSLSVSLSHRRDRGGGAALGWAVLLTIWAAYLAGGAVGAFAVNRWTARALLAPLCLIALASPAAFLFTPPTTPTP